MKGKVAWFSSKKGYGFIKSDEGKDIFVHHTGIKSSGFRELAEGESVEFNIEQTEKGVKAVEVKKI